MQEVANDMAGICHVICQWRTPHGHSITWQVFKTISVFYATAVWRNLRTTELA